MPFLCVRVFMKISCEMITDMRQSAVRTTLCHGVRRMNKEVGKMYGLY